jgi:hypothetical protein
MPHFLPVIFFFLEVLTENCAFFAHLGTLGGSGLAFIQYNGSLQRLRFII